MQRSASSTYWWLLPTGKAHEAVHAVLAQLARAATSRENEIRFNLRLYGERVGEFFGGVTTGGSDDPLPVNIIQSIPDALTARITKTRPRVQFIPTSGVSVGNWYGARQRAEKRTRFVDGTWRATGHRDMVVPWVLDGLICGDGWIKSYAANGAIIHERTFPENLWVDELDACNGAPSAMFERRYVDRYQLADLYPSKREMILGASHASYADMRGGRAPRSGYSSQSDQILVSEAWHLPVGPVDSEKGDAKGGRHVIAIAEGTLLDEDWRDQRFPFARWSWKKPQRGFYGRSIVDDLYPYQMSIFDALEMFRENMRTHGYARTFVERGSKVNEQHLTNGPRDIVEYTGQPPIVSAPKFVDGAVYEFIWRLHQMAHQQVGASELFAGARKPAGLNAAVAMRELTDIESERQSVPQGAYDQAHVDLAELDLMVATREAREGHPLKVTTLVREFGDTRAEVIDWTDIGAEGEEFIVQPYPSSGLPQTPAGRKQHLAELYADGLITKDEYAAQLEIPAVDQVLRERSAGRRLIEKRLGDIIERGAYYPPEPFLPLDVALQMGRDAYMQAAVALPPEEDDEDAAVIMNNLRKWIDQTQELMGKGQEPPPGPPPGAPPGMGAPPPPPPGATTLPVAT